MLTYDELLKEANRCLNCRNKPCEEKGCPINLRIPEFIKKFIEGNYLDAYKIIEEKSYLGSVCGRICPRETQCEGSCVRGIKGEPVAIRSNRSIHL